MRLLRLLIALSLLAAGVVVGALNPQPVLLDLGIARLPGTLGVLLLAALLAGVAAGGLAVAVSVALPMRRALKKAGQRPIPPNDQAERGV